MKTIFIILATITTATAGQFTNLGFEDPNLSHVVGGRGPTSEVLQGWTLKNENGISYPQQTIVTPNLAYPASLTSAPSIPGTGVDFGKNALFLGPIFPSLLPVYTLSQSGTIPINAAQLLFYNSSSPAIILQINGQSIPYANNIFTGIVNVDISTFAGQQVDLSFTFPKGAPLLFDIAGFTTVPEPSTYALFGFGAAMLWYHRRHRSR